MIACVRTCFVCACVLFFFCHVLWRVLVSTFVILSPTDYQSILAELQSPAALHSDPHFLEPELPVTPNPTLALHHHHHYPDPTTPLLADPQPQHLPWSPEIEPANGEAESPPRSPPRPCELALSVPAFELPSVPPSVRKPHIALNDELLLSEEEDRSSQEMELNLKPKAHSPEKCELDKDMAYSTSSLSASSISPTSPEIAQNGQEEQQISAPSGALEDVEMNRGEKEVPEKIEEVVGSVSAELVKGNEAVEGEEQECIKRVEGMDDAVKRNCEMMANDRPHLSEENVLVEKRGESAEEGRYMITEQHILVQGDDMGITCGVQGVREVQNLTEEEHNRIGMGVQGEENSTAVGVETACKFMEERAECIDETAEIQQWESNKVDEGSGERVCQDEITEDEDGELQFKGEGVSNGSVGIVEGTSEDGEAAEDQAVADLSPQAWVVALGERQPSDSGSNEEEEDGDKSEAEEALRSLSEEVTKEEGSEAEGEEEGEEMTKSRVQENLDQVEQAEKDMCLPLGWHSESSSVNVEPPTPGRSVSSDLLDRRENSQENSSDSITSSSRGESGRSRHNGDSQHSPQDSSPESSNSRKEEGTLVSERKVQQRVSVEAGSEEEQTVTTKIFRRRLILKGEQAKNVPGESVTEEHFIDGDGNLISRKVIRKVIRRVSSTTPEDQERDRDMWHRGDPWSSSILQEEEPEQGEGTKNSRRKEERRSGDKKLHS
ncbi:neurofilament medium polypeptide-like [Myripristis murdjan]|uniref:neurofilament medium polypeptide-like n=1 Tax=Myripristis murdjan TaxID=586833 RepID=UPI0011761F19|nr:neurofilament medium polypeptide-like [Myripristis murdjan]